MAQTPTTKPHDADKARDGQNKSNTGSQPKKTPEQGKGDASKMKDNKAR